METVLIAPLLPTRGNGAYSPGHTWYYLFNEPLPIIDIESIFIRFSELQKFIGIKDKKRKNKVLFKMLQEAEK
jgi:hypothetical protein